MNRSALLGILGFCILFLALVPAQRASAVGQSGFTYYNAYGAALVPIMAEVDDLDRLHGVGAGISYADHDLAPWVGRLGGEYYSTDQSAGGASGRHRAGAGYLEVLWGPGFALDRSIRWYAGGGIGFLHERLELTGNGSTADYTGTGLLLSGTAGIQFEWLDVMLRVIYTEGTENLGLSGIIAVGLALGPF